MEQERTALQRQLETANAAADAGRSRGEELERQLAESRREGATAKEALATKEAQAQVGGGLGRGVDWAGAERGDWGRVGWDVEG